jgi:Amt family ammonium transporter
MTAQVIGVLAVLVFTLVVSYILARISKQIVGIRVSDDEIERGLDVSSHGQSGYKL